MTDRAASNVLIDNWSGKRSALLDLLEIAGFTLVTALLAQVRIPLPFTPVPITGETLGVLLAGVVLGARRAFLSQVLYLAAGAAGLYVFAGGTLTGPTAGYLWCFPLAAVVTGWLVERGAARRSLTLAGALLLADACILAGGTLWLRSFLGVSLGRALRLGAAPFWVGDLFKIALVAALMVPALKKSRRLSRP
ncbi:MAG TPA: biotin transporter BioY [Terriglobia bacterium]|nr:biotin transporter BioY [Terriglobia bacterium]